MPEATAADSEIITVLLGDNQDLSIYIAEAVTEDLLRHHQSKKLQIGDIIQT